jgi:hypothetical protein
MASLMSAADLYKVAYCFATLTNGAQVEYELTMRDVKYMRGKGSAAAVPMVKIHKRGLMNIAVNSSILSAINFINISPTSLLPHDVS